MASVSWKSSSRRRETTVSDPDSRNGTSVAPTAPRTVETADVLRLVPEYGASERGVKLGANSELALSSLFTGELPSVG
jgi:hypothetical protein